MREDVVERAFLQANPVLSNRCTSFLQFLLTMLAWIQKIQTIQYNAIQCKTIELKMCCDIVKTSKHFYFEKTGFLVPNNSVESDKLRNEVIDSSLDLCWFIHNFGSAMGWFWPTGRKWLLMWRSRDQSRCLVNLWSINKAMWL